MGSPVVHFEIHGKDGAKLTGFYRDVFGWKVDSDNPMAYGLVDTDSGDNGIGGGISGEGTGIIVYAQVDDLQATLDKVERLGGQTVMAPAVIPGMVTMALFSDPEGNTFGIVGAETPPA